jgi:hypothetical protein
MDTCGFLELPGHFLGGCAGNGLSQSFDELHSIALIPWSARIDVAVFSLASGVIIELADDSGRRRNFANHQWILTHVVRSCSSPPGLT